MTLVRYNPNRHFDTGFDRYFSGILPTIAFDSAEGTSAVISPRVEIKDSEEAVQLTAEVPGIDKDNLKVEVNKRVLTLSGEKRAESEQEEKGIYRSERVYGAFKRSFNLPDEVDVDKIAATMDNGVLSLTLPKRPEAKPKLISIGSGNGGAKKIDVS